MPIHVTGIAFAGTISLTQDTDNHGISNIRLEPYRREWQEDTSGMTTAQPRRPKAPRCEPQRDRDISDLNGQSPTEKKKKKQKKCGRRH